MNLTKGNVIEIAGSPANGYCIQGSNEAGTTKAAGGTAATAGATFFWYDSLAGGLQTGAPSKEDTTAVAGKACAGVDGDRLAQAG